MLVLTPSGESESRLQAFNWMDKQFQVAAAIGLHTNLGPGSQMNLYVVKTKSIGSL